MKKFFKKIGQAAGKTLEWLTARPHIVSVHQAKWINLRGKKDSVVPTKYSTPVPRWGSVLAEVNHLDTGDLARTVHQGFSKNSRGTPGLGHNILKFGRKGKFKLEKSEEGVKLAHHSADGKLSEVAEGQLTPGEFLVLSKPGYAPVYFLHAHTKELKEAGAKELLVKLAQLVERTEAKQKEKG